MMESTDGFVYFVRNIGTDEYKIGFSQVYPTLSRLKQVLNSISYGLVIDLIIPDCSYQDEQSIHRFMDRFRNRSNGEWFYMPPKAWCILSAELILGQGKVPRSGLRTTQRDHFDFFLNDNFYCSPKEPDPSTEIDCISLDDLFKFYQRFCNYDDLNAMEFKQFRTKLACLDIGRKHYGSKIYFRAMLKHNSILQNSDVGGHHG